MLIVESEFRIGYSVWQRANVSADACRVSLERQHVEVTHHLHVFAAFVSLGNLDFNGRRVGRIGVC